MHIPFSPIIIYNNLIDAIKNICIITNFSNFNIEINGLVFGVSKHRMKKVMIVEIKKWEHS